jgi:hypothetical protein
MTEYAKAYYMRCKGVCGREWSYVVWHRNDSAHVKKYGYTCLRCSKIDEKRIDDKRRQGRLFRV